VKKLYRSKNTSDVEIVRAPRPSRLWDPPAGLGRASEAFFRRVGKHLLRVGILNDLTRESFENMVLLHDRIQEMTDVIKKEGSIIPDKNGSIKRHPALIAQSAAFLQFKALAAEFGLLPSAGNRLGINLKQKEDHTEKFLFGDES